MRNIFYITLLLFAQLAFCYEIAIHDSLTIQRTDGSGLFDIYYQISEAEFMEPIEISLSAYAEDGERLLITSFEFGSEIGTVYGNGLKHIIWNFAIDNPGREFYDNQIIVEILANEPGTDPWACDYRCISVGGAENDCLYDAAYNPFNGDIVTVGYTENYGEGNSDILVCVLHDSGVYSVDCFTIGGDEFDEAKAIMIDSSGVKIIGRTNSFGLANYDLFLVQLNHDDYSLINAYTFGTDSEDYGTGINNTLSLYAQGTTSICGYSWNGAFGNWDIYYACIYTDSLADTTTYCAIFGDDGDDRAYAIESYGGTNSTIVGSSNSWEIGMMEEQSIIILNVEGDSLISSTIAGGDSYDEAFDIYDTWICGYTRSYGTSQNGIIISLNSSSEIDNMIISDESANISFNKINYSLGEYFVTGEASGLGDMSSLEMLVGKFNISISSFDRTYTYGDYELDAGMQSIFSPLENRNYHFGYTLSGAGEKDVFIVVSDDSLSSCCGTSNNVRLREHTPRFEHVDTRQLVMTLELNPVVPTITSIIADFTILCIPDTISD